jgi:2-oxoglutarate ferredoxin oxidoreductase subunit delta
MYAVIVDLRLCKKCGICSFICPKDVFSSEGSVVNKEKCSGCRLCELYCPDFAIEVVKTKEEDRNGVVAGE